jgi:hypothetical protein
MSTKFTAGQKVKCIKAGGSDNKLQEGTVYTVERVEACGEVYLVELKNPHTYSGWYGAKRFEVVTAPEFKDGDRVRIVRRVDGPRFHWNAYDMNKLIGRMGTVRDGGYGVSLDNGSIRVVADDDGGEHWYYLPESLELVTAPQDGYCITIRFPYGGQGVTQFFATEQEAREYVEKFGSTENTYELRPAPAPVVLKVQEETTVTRSVIAA